MDINEERIKTNLLMLDYFDMWDEFHYKSIGDTKTLRYYNLINNLIDSQLDAGIRWLDSDDAKDYFYGEIAYQKEVFEALESEWDSILEGKYSSVDALLSEVYRRGKAKGYADMQERIKYTKQDKLALKFAQEYNFGLIRKIDNDVRNQIKGKIVSGFLAGDHPNTIAPKILSIGEERLEGSTFSPRQRATMIARTEVSRVQNTGILQSYVNEGYTEVKILTAEDNNVCTICLKYAYKFNKNDEITYENRGKEKVHNIFKLITGDYFPPFHPNCRCTYLSVWESKGEPPENPICVYLIYNGPHSKEELERRANALTWKELKDEDIPDYFSDTLKKAIKLFDADYENFDDGNEWARMFNITLNDIDDLVSDGKPDEVDPFKDKDYGDDELILLHNHPRGTFLSDDDFLLGFFRPENIKCIVVHTNTHIFIAHFKKSPETLEDLNRFLDEYDKIYGRICNPDSWFKFNSNEITREYVSVDMVVKK